MTSLPRPVALFACTALVAATSSAQSPRTITHENVSYTLEAITANMADSLDCDFTADAQFAPDVLREHWWWFRFDGDQNQRPFADDGSLTETFNGRRAQLDWADLDGRGLLAAQLSLEVTSTGLESGVLLSRLTLTNLTDQPVPITLFHYADIDACDPHGDSALGTGANHTVVGSCTLQQVRLRATLVDHWQIEDRDDRECGLLDPGPLTLGDSTLPFVHADYTSALQWRRVVQPGLPQVLITRMTHLSGPCGPATSTSYGFGQPGINGTPTLSTYALPRLGHTAALRVENAAPNSVGFYVFGFDRAQQPLGNLTLLVQVGPRGAQFDFVTGLTDAQGTGLLPVNVPANLSLCAEMLYWQAFVLDTSVQGTLPFSQTAAVQWQLGR